MRYLYLIVLLLLLGSCKRYVYRPTTVKPTNFTNKGDCEFSVNAFTMAEFHGAYAVTDHLAISGTIGRGTTRDTTKWSDSLGQLSSQRIGSRKLRDNELAIGFFTPLGRDGMGSFEFFAGMGFAHRVSSTVFTDFKNSANNSSSLVTDNRYTRLFFQPSYGMNTKFIDVAISNRFSFITYPAISTTDFISETVMTMRYGYKNVKLMTQVGFTIFDPDAAYGYLPFTFGFGIYLMFNKNMKRDGY